MLSRTWGRKVLSTHSGIGRISVEGDQPSVICLSLQAVGRHKRLTDSGRHWSWSLKYSYKRNIKTQTILSPCCCIAALMGPMWSCSDAAVANGICQAASNYWGNVYDRNSHLVRSLWILLDKFWYWACAHPPANQLSTGQKYQSIGLLLHHLFGKPT